MSGKSEAHAMATAQGERIAGFILITWIDGTRYAVRQHAVSVIDDGDECHDETMFTCMVGSSLGCLVRSMKCWCGSRNVATGFSARRNAGIISVKSGERGG